MAEYSNESLGIRIGLPDKITVRQQLEYHAVRSFWDDPAARYEQAWKAALPLLTLWECPALPDRTVSLDSLTESVQTRIVMWVGGKTAIHVTELEAVPKDSSPKPSPS